MDAVKEPVKNYIKQLINGTYQYIFYDGFTYFSFRFFYYHGNLHVVRCDESFITISPFSEEEHNKNATLGGYKSGHMINSPLPKKDKSLFKFKFVPIESSWFDVDNVDDIKFAVSEEEDEDEEVRVYFTVNEQGHLCLINSDMEEEQFNDICYKKDIDIIYDVPLHDLSSVKIADVPLLEQYMKDHNLRNTYWN